MRHSVVALSYLLICFFGFAQGQSKKDVMDSLRDHGQQLIKQDEFDKGIALFLESIKMAEEEGYTYKVATLLSQIGNANLRNGNLEAALDFNEKAHKTILSVKDRTKKITYITAGIKNNLALAYHGAERYQNALAIYFSQFEGFLLSAYDSSRTYSNIARTYAQIQQFDSAIYFLNLAKPLREAVDKPNHTAYAYKEYATIYNETGDYAQSVTYGKKVLEIGMELENSGHIEDGYRNLRNAYYNWGKYKESAEYGEKYASFLNEMHNLERDEIITEMQTKYDVAQKDREIEQLNFETIIAKRTKITLIVIIFSVLIVAYMVIIYLRKSIKKQRLEKELTQTQLSLKQQELLKKQEELNHFVEIIQEKNKLIDAFEEEVEDTNSKKEELLPKLYESVILTEDDWKHFKEMFENVYDGFFAKLKNSIPSITTSEMRLSALMKLNLTTKEISGTLGISPNSVTKAKYRIKQKLEVEDSKELQEFVMAIG